MGDVSDTARPDQAVAGLGAAASGVGDHLDDPWRERVLDDEREHGLRQEARLEHAAAVLVRDAALASVPDRLDDPDAHVARLLLDRVDDRLDPLSNHDRLDLDHAIRALRRSSSTVS